MAQHIGRQGSICHSLCAMCSHTETLLTKCACVQTTTLQRMLAYVASHEQSLHLHIDNCDVTTEQLQGLFEHKTKVPSLLNPATHTFKMSEWADKATVGEGDMGTNVVWMYPQVCESEVGVNRRVHA